MGLKGMTIVIIKLNNTFILSTETSSHPSNWMISLVLQIYCRQQKIW